MSFCFVVMRRRDQKASGITTNAAFKVMAKAMRSGELPNDRALDQPLLAIIRRRRPELRRASILTPCMFGGFAVLSLLLAIHHPIWLIYTAGSAVFGIGLAVSMQRSKTRFARLEARVGHRLNTT